MPSSPTFIDFKRQPYRFVYRGVSLLPQEILGEGKLAYAQNIRSYVDGTITTRDGARRLTGGVLNGAVNALQRLNDPALLAGGAPARRFAGTSAGSLYSGIPAAGTGADGYSAVDTGYSGDPLSLVPAMPVNSPQPWIYIGDTDRLRKVNAALDVRSIGLPPPVHAASARLAANQTTFLQSIDAGTWVAYGPTAGAVMLTNPRVSGAVVNLIIYDEGVTGMCSIALDDMSAVTQGATVDLGGALETVIAQEIITAISTTTIAAILYDAGNSGLCTIQPTGSFALSQTEAASPEELYRRYHDLDVPMPQGGLTISRPIDYPVNGIVMLNGVEAVRIVSVAIGTDGVMSFRAVTAGTYVAGQSIEGVPCFRAFTNTTIVLGDPASAPAAQNVITPVDATTPAYAGVQTAVPDRDWSQTGNRAMQPDDLITFSINISQLAVVSYVRLLLASIDGAAPGEEFTQNFYQYDWRANDLIQAMQTSLTEAAVAGTPQTMLEAQQAAVASGQAETFYQDGYGTEPLIVGGSASGDGPLVATGPATPRTDGFVTAGTAPSRQLALGNLQWITLHCRVRDLLRSGTDPARNLSNINAAAVVVQIEGTADPITVRYSDVYLTGGYGPDCGATSPPYVYRYRYRSTITGERGNPSPSMRAGMPARRQRVTLTAIGSTAPQCDVIDWFRFGGALARWTYVRSVANDVTGGNVTAHDDMADRQIDGGETLRVDLFQPWPTSDLPRSGTCRVVGTSVEWISGDVFDLAWSPDTLMLVNGRATSLYGSPTSPTRLQVIDNCDSGDPVTFSLPSPTLLAQPLTTLWGGFVQDVWFHFACGDPTDPGALHWSHGNDPDASSDANTVAVTPSSEPLQNGCVWDTTAYVFSTEGLYRLDPKFGSLATFQPVRTACSRGLWNRWAFCLGNEGIYFVAPDGIFVTAGGEESSIVDPDLRPLFPRDGSEAVAAGSCLDAIDFTQPMKLTRVDAMIYFDYVTVLGAGATLVYEPRYQRWTPDAYVSGVRARMSEPGPSVHSHIIGCASGQIYQMEADTLTDDGTAVSWLASTPWAIGGDARQLHQWGDAVLDVNPGGSFDGVRVEPVVDYGRTGLTPTTGLGASTHGRSTYLVEVAAVGDTLGTGVLSQSFGLLLSGVTQQYDTARPVLHFWEPAWLDKQTVIARRATGWEDLGYAGAKFVQGVVIRANTFGLAKSLAVQGDGATALTLTINHDGERTLAYPLAAAGWTPFAAELVRLLGTDDVAWTLLDWRWVWEPAPELATQWETQDTTFDFPGYGSIADGVLAYQSSSATTLWIWHGASALDYVIPSSGGLYQRLFLKFAAAKGLSYRFRWTGDQPFRVYQRDTSMRATPWGAEGGYRIVSPFGGPSRISGAEV